MTFDLISKNRKDKVYNSNCLNRRMRNNMSIEECLKELNDDVLKNIREDYKKGNNLNKIIKHHSTKKPESLSKIYNLIKFEFDEQERFLRDKLSLSYNKIFFFELNKESYGEVIKATRQGIQEGVQDFLKRNNAWQLYLSDLSAFCYDCAVKDKVEKEVSILKLKLSRMDIPQYASYTKSCYAGFISNESDSRFNTWLNK